MKKTICVSLLFGAMLVCFSACDKDNTEPATDQTEQESGNNNKPSGEPDKPNKPEISGTESGHDYVDMGLPSGTLWATCNVGASKPEEYGNYYAWGETITKTKYVWNTYQYGSGTQLLTKYCNKASYGESKFVDDKISLDIEDDAARSNWGGKWRMPTKDEQSELFNKANCYWVWTNDYITTDDDSEPKIGGYIVTSRKNGNTIFFPATGYVVDDNLVYEETYGGYWSSDLDIKYPSYAVLLHFGSFITEPDSDEYSRYYGQVVRAVFK